MNIQAEKLHIMKMILETENPEILHSIKKLFAKQKKTDFWNTIGKDQQDEIELGVDEVERGETVDYESLMKKHRK